MSYLLHESLYQSLIARFIQGDLDAETFVDSFFKQWRTDRDAQFASLEAGHVICPEEDNLCEIVDQIFTACDCFCSPPKSVGAIGAEQLQAEVRQHATARWRGIVA